MTKSRGRQTARGDFICRRQFSSRRSRYAPVPIKWFGIRVGRDVRGVAEQICGFSVAVGVNQIFDISIFKRNIFSEMFCYCKTWNNVSRHIVKYLALLDVKWNKSPMRRSAFHIAKQYFTRKAYFTNPARDFFRCVVSLRVQRLSGSFFII